MVVRFAVLPPKSAEGIGSHLSRAWLLVWAGTPNDVAKIAAVQTAVAMISCSLAPFAQ